VINERFVAASTVTGSFVPEQMLACITSDALSVLVFLLTFASSQRH